MRDRNLRSVSRVLPTPPMRPDGACYIRARGSRTNQGGHELQTRESFSTSGSQDANPVKPVHLAHYGDVDIVRTDLVLVAVDGDPVEKIIRLLLGLSEDESRLLIVKRCAFYAEKADGTLIEP